MAFTAYAILADIRSYQLLDADQTGDDVALQGFLNDAQNWIDILTHWSFHQETRTLEELAYPFVKIDNEGNLNIRVNKFPVQSVAVVSYRFRPMDSWTAVTANTIETYPATAVQEPLPQGNLIKCYTYLSASAKRDGARVQLTYTGGFSGSVPPSLNWLCARLGAYLYRGRAAGGDKTVFPQAGAVVIPSGWPQDIKLGIKAWSRVA